MGNTGGTTVERTRPKKGSSGGGGTGGIQSHTDAKHSDSATARRPPLDHDHVGSGAAHGGNVAHASTTGQTADDHHAKSHGHTGADGSGTVAHASTTGQTADDHHAKSHGHTGADGSGTVAHSATTGRTANDHHNQAHTDADHTDAATAARTPTAHAASHASGGSDAIGGALSLAGSSKVNTGQAVTLQVDTGSTCALWLAGNSAVTDGTGGLAFGPSKDVKLYRAAAGVLRTDSRVDSLGASTSTAAFGTLVSGDSSLRLQVRADGQMQWGPGNASADTFFYRNGSGNMQFDNRITVNGSSIDNFGNLIQEDATNIVLRTTTGTKIGTATNQKLGFYNATPVVQPSGTPAASTDLASVIALANSLRTNLLALGLVA